MSDLKIRRSNSLKEVLGKSCRRQAVAIYAFCQHNTSTSHLS